MTGNTLRKIFVALIIIAPVFSYTGCKRQAKCGCGKDVVKTLTNASAYIYWDTPGSISFRTVLDQYSTYIFCNPTEMFPNLADAKSGDILLVSGHAYYDCNYVYQSSNSSYQTPPRYYVQVTGLTLDLYGKNKPTSETTLNSVNPHN